MTGPVKKRKSSSARSSETSRKKSAARTGGSRRTAVSSEQQPRTKKSAARKKSAQGSSISAQYHWPKAIALAVQNLFTLRALDVKVVDLRGLSDITDYYVIGTCSNEPQMQAILNALQRTFKSARIPTLGVEYRAGARWAVLDVVDVMIHLFEETARAEYALEKLWQDGTIIPLNPSDFIQNAEKTDMEHEFL